tara:strand:- start:1021 stop:1182 length:162 start_codon:yes stop_codon:yes gene_type:complete
MIGDGVTDLEARSDDGLGASLFVGFGGNQCREKVKEQADVFIYSFQDLLDVLA